MHGYKSSSFTKTLSKYIKSSMTSNTSLLIPSIMISWLQYLFISKQNIFSKNGDHSLKMHLCAEYLCPSTIRVMLQFFAEASRSLLIVCQQNKDNKMFSILHFCYNYNVIYKSAQILKLSNKIITKTLHHGALNQLENHYEIQESIKKMEQNKTKHKTW